MIIAVSGVDCAGKSTQIDLLLAHLQENGRRPKQFWYRPGYSAELDALRSMIRKLRPGAIPSPGKSDEREKAFANPALQKRWAMAAIWDAMLQYAIKLRGWNLIGKTVVCDRYLSDATLDLRLRFPNLAVDGWSSLRWLKSAAPKPDLSILLMLPREEFLKRLELKNEPFPDSPEMRDKRFSAYQELAASGDFVVIDGDRPIVEVQQSIVDALDS
jgi:thymidylate kinase